MKRILVNDDFKHSSLLNISLIGNTVRCNWEICEAVLNTFFYLGLAARGISLQHLCSAVNTSTFLISCVSYINNFSLFSQAVLSVITFGLSFFKIFF